MSEERNTWTVLLAAGEGSRLREFATAGSGTAVASLSCRAFRPEVTGRPCGSRAQMTGIAGGAESIDVAEEASRHYPGRRGSRSSSPRQREIFRGKGTTIATAAVTLASKPVDVRLFQLVDVLAR